MELLKKNHIKYLYFLVCAIYAFLISTSTNYFSPLEELGIPNMLANGEWYGIAGVRLIDGRFNVLLGLDIFLIQKLHSFYPITETEFGIKAFYIFIAFSFAFTAFVAHKLISKTFSKEGGNMVYLMLIFIFLSPIFVYTNFRLLYTERYLFLVFLLLIIAAIKFEKKKSYSLIFVIVLLANIGIHLKEVSFLSLLCLTGFYLYKFILDKNQNKKEGLLGMLLFASCVSYILIYIFYIKPMMLSRYGDSEVSFILMLSKNIYRWVITQPFLVFLFVPITFKNLFYRIYKREMFSVSDALSLAGIAFMFGYLILSINPNEYYLAPVYAFAVYTIGLEISTNNYYRKLWFKGILMLCFLIHINSISFGINDIILQKYSNRNFYSMIDELETLIAKNTESDDKKMNIYVADCLFFGREGVMFYPIQFLINQKSNNAVEYKIYGYCDFELSQINQTNNPELDTLKDDTPVKGDYIIYTPYSQIDQIQFEQSNLKLIKDFPAPTFFQNVNVPYLIKSLISNKSIIKNKLAYSANYAIYQIE